MESQILVQRAASNSKEQYATSPDLKGQLLDAIMGALDAHTDTSTQALNSETIQEGLFGIRLDDARLWEGVRPGDQG